MAGWFDENRPTEPYATTPGAPIPTVNDSGLAGSATTPGAPITTSGGSPNDREYVKQQLASLMQQHGVTPGPRGSGPADIEYYTDQAMATGGWTPDNAGYWQDRWQSDARGGGGAGGGGGLSGFGGGNSAMLAPFTGQAPQFTPPTGVTMLNDPGYQFALEQGLKAGDQGAAARGTIFTGGHEKDRMDYATGLASQHFGDVFNRALQTQGANMGTFGANYDIFRNNQNDPFSKLFSVTGLGLNAAQSQNQGLSQYGTNLANLSTGIGNARSAGTVAGSNALSQGIGSIADWYQNWLAGRGRSSSGINDVTLQPR